MSTEERHKGHLRCLMEMVAEFALLSRSKRARLVLKCGSGGRVFRTCRAVA